MIAGALTVQRVPQRHGNQRQGVRQHSRRATVISTAWTPRWEPEPEPAERFGSIFSAPWIPPSENPLTVFDARDAIEACSGLWGEERQECFAVFGVDGGRVDAFYSTVFNLEMALAQDTDPEEEASHRGKERC
ncbi:hypothetical protein ACK3TF_000689 [Chlorella vulgaris]